MVESVGGVMNNQSSTTKVTRNDYIKKEECMQAKALIDGGYSIVPINVGQKGPRVKEWQIKEFKAEDIKAGIGVKTGVGTFPLCAVDIDVLDAGLASKFADHCQNKFGMTVERVGQAPKTMLVYRASEAGWSKATSAWFEDKDGVRQRLEILGKGQQFVAYHIHPDTKKPYVWVDMLGGLEYTPAADLPVLTADDVKELVSDFEAMAKDAGLIEDGRATGKVEVKRRAVEDSDDFTNGIVSDYPLSKAKEDLSVLDASDYEFWISMGMALHRQFGGSEEALEVFDDWSKTADNYSGYEDVESHWRSFNPIAGGITALSIAKFANEARKTQSHKVKKSAIEEYKARIEDCEDSLELEDVLKSIGRELDPQEIITCDEVKSAAKDKYKDLVGRALSEASANKLLGLAKDTSSENLERQTAYTEFGNATRMLELHGDDLMFTTDTETWYRWTGSYWRISTHAELEQVARETIMTLLKEGAEAGMLAGDQFDFIKGSLNARMMQNMVKILRTEDKVLVTTDELDSDKNILGCANGAVDLTTGTLLPAERMDRITLSTGINYDPNAKCPVFEQTVREAFFEDDELVAFFQRLMGYTILGNPKEDFIIIPYGTGSNGKSTILGAIRDALGAHAITASNETFLGRVGGSNAGGPRDDILRLRGSRFVYVTEPDDDRELKEGLIKSMTGGEAMVARAAYSRTYIQFPPTFTVVLPTNHKPIIKGDDFGIWRRILLIPFTRNFSKDPDIVKDANRGAKLEKEHEGILTWLVNGAIDYLNGGLRIPKVIEQARDEYKSDMDLLSEWKEECCVIGPNQVATNRELWESWKRFAEDRGELMYIRNAKTLNKKIEARESVTRIKDTMGIRGRGLQGISVRSLFDEDEEQETEVKL